MTNKVSLFDLTWKKAVKGYATEPHPIKHNKSKKYPTDPFPENIIKPTANNEFIDYKIDFTRNKHGVGICRSFAMILNDDGQSINEKRAIKFANRYGLLGLTSYSYEGLNAWVSIAKDLKRIYGYMEQNENLDYSRAITLFNGGTEHFRLKPMIYSEGTPNSSSMHFRPINLITAMYLILAEELSGNIVLKKCQNQGCMGWFPDRRNKKFCNPSCKSAAHKKKTKLLSHS